ncbi:MAG TPA: choice-of-anchor tandem repeat GloVer-containing protein [Verrucomicrobiae bacterium]|nr:choice-of-anchor tandem repeat GloVer-containing protein [Verrucomicrobiae bacterium]
MSTIRCVKILPLLVSLFAVTGANASVVLTTLASFGGTNGANPEASLLLGADGFLYGTTTGGGTSNLGTVFRISPGGGDLSSLASFSRTNGAFPKAGLIQQAGEDPSLFGTTFAGGVSDLGTIFKITTNGTLSTLVSFHGTNGANPQAALATGDNGDLYGTTYYGGTNSSPGYGVVFQVTTNSVFTPLISLANTNGAYPYGPLRRGADENYYGTSELGGDAGLGSVFKISSAGVLSTIASFYGTNGALPRGGLIQGADGHFYGTTTSGGTSNQGTVFRVTASGNLTTLISFVGTNGAAPFAGMTDGGDGSFYGAAAQGGPNLFGTVFQITTNGVLTTLVAFDSSNGRNPYAGLVRGSDGSLYGTTANGGAHGLGTVYRISFPAVSLPIVQTLTQAGNSAVLTWNATVGRNYQVQYKTNLNDITWTDWIATLTATNSTMTLLPNVGPETQRFYRVGLLP